jgi:uncharacterized damage-inducible protein DinB
MKSQFLYKRWANSALLNSLSQVDGERFPDQKTAAVRFLNHTLVVDKIFIAHIQGEAHHFSSANTTEMPALNDLSDSIHQADTWLIDYVSNVESQELDRKIQFVFTDGDPGLMTVGEMLSHLIIHGAYHRGNVGMILVECGLENPRDTFPKFLHQFEPSRRTA